MAPAHMLIHMNTHNAHLHRLICITTLLAVEVHNLHASSLTRVTRKLNGESRGQVRRGMKLCCLGERYSEIQSDRGRQFCGSSLPKWSAIVYQI